MFKTTIKWADEIENLKNMGKQGLTMADVAKQYGVSRQRIKQVTAKFLPEWKETYGHAVRNEQKEERWKAKWGHKQDTDLYHVQRDKFRAKKYNAERTGYTWGVEFGDIEWPTHCPILGLELNYFAEFRQENSVSFDRIDSNIGYEKGNIQILSWRANRIKNDGSAEEHRLIANYLDSIA